MFVVIYDNIVLIFFFKDWIYQPIVYSIYSKYM